MRRYKVIQGGGLWGVEDGTEIEIDLDAEGEAEFVDARKFLEIAPTKYEVIGAQEVHGTGYGETFEAALPVAQEAALVEGGHVRLVEPVEPLDPKKATKAELLEQAEELGLDVSPGMTKDEIAEAIAEAASEDEEEGGNT